MTVAEEMPVVENDRKTSPIHQLDFSIVLAGTGFSPTSYSAETLIDKGIVPDSWKITNSVSNNLLSITAFDDGRVVLRVEKTKIIIADNLLSETDTVDNSEIPNVAKNFIEKYKHLTFSAIGINFDVIFERPTEGSFLLNNFIVPDRRKTGDYEVHSAGVKLMYNLEGGGLLTIDFVDGMIDKNTTERTLRVHGTNCQGNFHRDFTSKTTVDELITQIQNYKQDWVMFNNIINGIVKS